MPSDDKKSQDSHLKQLEFQAHLEEYRALCAQQRTRIGTQRNITYLLVLLLAAILGAATGGSFFQFPGLSLLLLLTPIFTSALSFLYLENDLKFIRIGRYILGDLRKKVGLLLTLKKSLNGF